MNKGLRRNGAYSDQIHSHDVDDLPKDEIARIEVGIISVDEKTSINKFDDVSQHDVGIVCATRTSLYSEGEDPFSKVASEESPQHVEKE